MSKLSVRQYAELQNVTVQYVYKQINNGNLEVSEIDGKKYIIIEDKEDFEKKYNEIKHKYDILEKENEYLKLMIDFIKEQQNIYTNILEKPKKKKKDFKPKKKKKKKEK